MRVDVLHTHIKGSGVSFRRSEDGLLHFVVTFEACIAGERLAYFCHLLFFGLYSYISLMHVSDNTVMYRTEALDFQLQEK